MKSLTKVLEQKSFLKNLFESIPCGVLVVDSERRVQAVNNVLEKTFGISGAEIHDMRGGDALKCVNALKQDKGCGFADECQSCRIRNTAMEAISGVQIHRHRASLQLMGNGKARNIKLLVSAAPFDHNDERLAIVILEDITELDVLRKRLKTEQSFAGIVGQEPRMQQLFETIRDITDVNIPVLIQGESGTGKELVAAAIHNEGIRSKKPFVPVNCGALPEGLLESELFGHVRGAFTGALRDKKGRFELAHGGTLFLDEVADLPKVVQAKLLRVLQEGTFEPVGGEKTISVNVRLISAANRDLKQEVEAGRFRDDLFYRLNVIPLYLPALRERKNDIPLLVEKFMATASEEGLKQAGVTKEALAVLMAYDWPGNIRELQSTIRYSLIMGRGDVIRPEHLPAELKNEDVLRNSRGPSRKLNARKVKDALTLCGGNKAKAARLLGVGRATLYRFLSDYPDIS